MKEAGLYIYIVSIVYTGNLAAWYEALASGFNRSQSFAYVYYTRITPSSQLSAAILAHSLTRTMARLPSYFTPDKLIERLQLGDRTPTRVLYMMHGPSQHALEFREQY